MMYVCLWSPAWSIAAASDESGEDSGAAAVAPLLAGLVPRLRCERELVWADGRGLDASRLAERLLAELSALGIEARAGVAAVPVAAELAARWGRPSSGEEGPTPFLVKERTGWGWRKPGELGERADSAASSPPERVVAVPVGRERAWLAELPLASLASDRVRTLLDGVGITTLGGLASLEREAVEVRLGGGAVELWRLARGDDRRLLFDRIPPERPHGSLDFVDYVLTDPSRLLFTANALLGPLCDRLVGRGEHARTLRLTLPLANGETWARTIRPARPTASRETWLRLIREILDRLTVPDAVTGMRLEVGVTEEAAVRQGDLFDRGFATAAAVEAAVARLAERQVHPLLPETTAHPLMERRATWRRRTPDAEPIRDDNSGPEEEDPVAGPDDVGLALQLLPRPRPIAVETARRRDHEAPTRIRDRREWREVTAAGPDRISGGQWETASYAREYYRCATAEGAVLWIYRDGLDGRWYLHGWWD